MTVVWTLVVFRYGGLDFNGVVCSSEKPREDYNRKCFPLSTSHFLSALESPGQGESIDVENTAFYSRFIFHDRF